MVPEGEYPSYAYDGPMPTKFYESPQSYQLVLAGQLPPVEDRLPVPEDVLVLDAMDKIGEYGGMWRILGTGSIVGDLDDAAHCMNRLPNEIDSIPEICKSFEVSADGTVWTFTMRRGAKWSDGVPLTMDDIRFAWLELNFNKDLNPIVPAEYRDAVTGNTVKFGVVDDWTWTLTFDTANFTLTDGKSKRGYDQCGGNRWCWFAPKHWLTKFHPAYASETDLQKLMDDNNFDNPITLMQNASSYRRNLGRPGPAMNAWKLQDQTDLEGYYVRNHYYVGVDPEGNQLPFFDERKILKMESREVVAFRTMAGEGDVDACVLRMEALPLAMHNMEKGDYSLYHWPTPGGSDVALTFNQTWNEDPELGKLIRTNDFRQALSLATDREGINNVLFQGLGTVQNWVPHPSTPYYPGVDWATKDTALDIDRANLLLDGLGLTTKDAQGYRLKTDGARISLEAVIPIRDDMVEVMELARKTWAQIGVELDYRSYGTYYRDVRMNQEYFSVNPDYSCYQHNPWNVSWTRLAPMTSSVHHANDIGRYYETRGEQGQSPTDSKEGWLPLSPEGIFPADVSGNLTAQHDLWEEGRGYDRYSPERIEIGKEIFRIQTKERYDISTVGFTGIERGLAVVRNTVENVPKKHTRECKGFWRQTYSFEGGIDNMHHPDNKSQIHESVSFLTGY